MNEITLVAKSGDSLSLKLNNDKKPYTVEDIFKVHCKVYSDGFYHITLHSDKDIENIIVYINGEATETDLRDDTLYFCGDNKNAFWGIIGLAQISLNVKYTDQTSEWLFSEYASVLIKTNDTNKTIDLMLKYVYENQEDFLQCDVKKTEMGKNYSRRYDDFWSQVVLFEEIANVYETNYGYFMANSRNRLKKIDVLDRAEKLQEVDSRTIQYIAQHPEYLKNSVSGIKSGRQYFLPSKTLMTQKRISFDILENQVVISFLELVLDELLKLGSEISEYIRMIRIEGESNEGYIVSSYLLYVNARKVLGNFLAKVRELENQYRKLVISYSHILNVKRIPMLTQPEPTAIFMRLPQYNRIYTCILRWFSKSGYDLMNEKVMLNYIDAPSIYEAYVLIKLINQVKESGYRLTESKLISYPQKPNWFYKVRKNNNTFVFENDTSKITIYYEPVIYDENRTNINNLALYRNNSVSLNHETDDERQGHYYVPDYVIKYEEEQIERYLICDAKFSRKNKVKYKLMPNLIYKYLTSVSPVSKNIEIEGLYVFYGINEEDSRTESFYDRQIKGTTKLNPQIEMLPLSENISYSDQEKNISEMLKSLMEGCNKTGGV